MNLKSSVLAAAVAASLCFAASASDDPTFKRFVVDLKPNADAERLRTTLEAHGVRVVRLIDDGTSISVAVEVDPDTLPDLATLADQLPDAAGYYPDARRELAVITSSFEDVELDGETTPWGIQAVGASNVSYAGGMKVCIIDTGYDINHPDLPQAGVDGTDRGAGAWDGSDGTSLHDHGTHVAGTIAALGGNNEGVVGIAPGGDLELYIVRTFDSGGGFVYATDLAGAMLDCAAAGSNIINMSLGGLFSSRVEERVVNKLQREGVLLVAAAGNGSTISGLEPRNDFATFSYPASYDAVMSVAAIDSSLERAPFSQYNTQVDVTGPGVGVLSTLVGGGYGNFSGTSMAAPHVAAVAALVWSHYPQCNSRQIRSALRNSALDLGEPGHDYFHGSGLVQAGAAFDYLAANRCRGNSSN